MTRRLWLVRHATPLVAPGTCYGRLDMQADAGDTARAAAALAAALPPVHRVATSPLRRCRQLAQELQRLRPAVAPVTDARLIEMDFGAWEGQAWNALGAAGMDAWMADFAGFAPGGGETVTALMARVRDAMEAAPAGDTVWITHAGVIRAATLIARGLPDRLGAADWPADALAFGSVTVVELPPVPAPKD